MQESKKPSVCMTTYFDKNFKQLGEISLKTLEKYSKKYGFDIKIYNNIKTGRPAPWNKIKIIQKILNDKKKYDFVFWLDSDALFVNYGKNILEEVEKDKEFYLAKHLINQREVPNTGVFLIRNSSWSKKFLEDVWNMEDYIYNKWWENAAVNYLLGFNIEESRKKEFILNILYKLKIKNMITRAINKLKLRKFLPQNKIKITKNKSKKTSYLKKVKWLDLKWNNLPEVLEVKNPIINHYPAMPYEERFKKMKKDLKETFER